MRSLFLILLLLTIGCKSTTRDPEGFNSLLDNLTYETTKNDTSGKPLIKTSSKLLMTDEEMNVLRNQLASCLNLKGVPKEDDISKVMIELEIGKDRIVNKAIISDKERYNQDPRFRRNAEIAIKAFRHPKCAVLDLPPEKYETWRHVFINFDLFENF